MVYKDYKGVRSGNTLRRFHILNARRYSRASCMMIRTRLNRHGMRKLAQSSPDDAYLADALNKTDVFLSLNKKQRWTVPATLRYKITTGKFESHAVVSMLEKHKLKRRANCVSFVISEKAPEGATRTQRRCFFEENRNSGMNEEHKKQSETLKKRIAALRKHLIPAMKHSKIKAIHAFKSPKPNPDTELVRSLDYKMEVFYPCSRNCSLSSSPKYAAEVFPIKNTQTGRLDIGLSSALHEGSDKNWKRTRNRSKTTKNTEDHLEDIDPLVEQDVAAMWVEADREEQCSFDSHNISHLHTDGNAATSESSSVAMDGASILSFAFAEAENEIQLHPRKTRSRKSKRRQNRRSLMSIGNENKMSEMPVGHRSSFGDRQHPSVPSTQQENHNLKFAKVLLTTQECSSTALYEQYGDAYGEADCEPRRFVINITDSVWNILGGPQSKADKLAFTSFLIFAYDYYCDSGLESFRVCFNSYLIKDNDSAATINSSVALGTCSVDDVMNQIFSCLLDLQLEGALELTGHKDEMYPPMGNHAKDIMSSLSKKVCASYKLYRPEEEICRMNLQDESRFRYQDDVIAFQMFCGICYEGIHFDQTGNSPGTSLKMCDHVFCDECWRYHVRNKLRNGSFQIKCPGYDCDVEVGQTTLLTLLSALEVGELLQRRRENEVIMSSTSKWCPNPSCGRVIQLDNDSQTCDVTCLCGSRICFTCLQPAHWPATCAQAQVYTHKLTWSKLTKRKDFRPSTGAHNHRDDFETEGRLCPRCWNFVPNKGCPYRAFSCACHYCWRCKKSIEYKCHWKKRGYNLKGQTTVHQIDLTYHRPAKDVDATLKNLTSDPQKGFEAEWRLCPRCRHFVTKTNRYEIEYCKCGCMFCWKCMNQVDRYWHTCTKSKRFDKLRLKIICHPNDIYSPGQTGTDKKPLSSWRQKMPIVQKAVQERLKGERWNIGMSNLAALEKMWTQALEHDITLKSEVFSICEGIITTHRDTESAPTSTKLFVRKLLRCFGYTCTAIHHVSEYTFVLLQDMPASTETSRVLTMATDLSASSSFIRSVLQSKRHRDAGQTIRQLIKTRLWANRTVNRLHKEVSKLTY